MPRSRKSSRNAELSCFLDSCRVFASQKCQRSQGWGLGGSWSQNADLPSLLDSRLVFASQKCQRSQGSGGCGRKTQNCRGFWTCVASSRLRVSKVSTITRIGGSWSELSSLLDSCRVLAFQKCQRHRDRGGRGGETQNCRHFWTCIFASSRLKSVNVTGIEGLVVAKRRILVTFGLAFGLRISRVSTVTRIGGSWWLNAEFSSLLDLRCVFASSRLKSVNTCGREKQNCRHFWTLVWSSRLKSVNGHRDQGVVVAKRRTVVAFGLALRLRVFASQKCQQSQGSGVVVRTVVTFGDRAGGSCSRNAELSSL